MVGYLTETSASRELTPCCRALLKDIRVFSGASYSTGHTHTHRGTDRETGGTMGYHGLLEFDGSHLS